MRPSSKMPFRRAGSWALAWGGVFCLAGVLMLATPAGAVQLVTDAEAALPPNNVPRPPALQGRNLSRLPKIEVLSPSQNAGAVQSPLTLKVRLQAFGGAKIDPDTVVVTYEKTPLINITQRIMPFVNADGINIPDAQVPAGTHDFHIEVTDSAGHVGKTDFVIQVVK